MQTDGTVNHNRIRAALARGRELLAEQRASGVVKGDREKPGAERAAKLILVSYVPPNAVKLVSLSLRTEAEAIQSSPRFFPVSFLQ
jgi:hypothetical protein